MMNARYRSLCGGDSCFDFSQGIFHRWSVHNDLRSCVDRAQVYEEVLRTPPPWPVWNGRCRWCDEEDHKIPADSHDAFAFVFIDMEKIRQYLRSPLRVVSPAESSLSPYGAYYCTCHDERELYGLHSMLHSCDWLLFRDLLYALVECYWKKPFGCFWCKYEGDWSRRYMYWLQYGRGRALSDITSAPLPSLSDNVRVEFDSKENTRTVHPLELEVVLAELKSPQGEQGSPGPQEELDPHGGPGPPGPNGRNCWDLNGNGMSAIPETRYY